MKRKRIIVFCVIVGCIMGTIITSCSKEVNGKSSLIAFKTKLLDQNGSPVIVCLGDSITEKNEATGEKENYVEYLNRLFKSINPKTVVINAGVSGDTTELALARLKTDVLDKKPDLTFIMLGVNDGSTWYPEVTYKQFRSNYLEIVKQVMNSNSAVILLTQNEMKDKPYHDTIHFDKYPDMEAGIIKIGKELNIPVIDNYPKWKDLKRQNKNLFNSLMSDAVHPNNGGHIYFFENIRLHLIGLLDLPSTVWGGNICIDEKAVVPAEPEYVPPTPDSSAGQLVGHSGKGATTDNCATDIDFNRFQAVKTGDATKIKVKLDNKVNGKLSCAVYADNAGSIGKKIIETAELVNPSAGWVVLQLKEPVHIIKGTYYHLVVWSNDENCTVCADFGDGRYTHTPVYPKWPESLPPNIEANDCMYCIYAY